MEAIVSSIIEEKIKAVKDIHAEFKDIFNHEKCRSCSCLYGDILNSVYEKIRNLRKKELDYCMAEIENDFERWIIKTDVLKLHG